MQWFTKIPKSKPMFQLYGSLHQLWLVKLDLLLQWLKETITRGRFGLKTWPVCQFLFEFCFLTYQKLSYSKLFEQNMWNRNKQKRLNIRFVTTVVKWNNNKGSVWFENLTSLSIFVWILFSFLPKAKLF